MDSRSAGLEAQRVPNDGCVVVISQILLATGKGMKITDFNVQIAHREGKRQQLSIAQIAEVMAVADALLDGQLYALIRRLGCACENPPVKRKAA